MDTREEVLRLLQEGIKPAQIAARLGISRQAVSKHVAALRKDGRLPDVPKEKRETTREVVNRRPEGAPPGNKNAVVTGEYETLWDAGLTEVEQLAMRNAWTMPVLEQLNRQIGLLDVRIGRALKRVATTKALLEAGVEMQLVGRAETLVGEKGLLAVANNTLLHKSEVLERQEKALDRMLQRRERLLALKLAAELKLAKLTDPDAGQDSKGNGRDRRFDDMTDEELERFVNGPLGTS